MSALTPQQRAKEIVEKWNHTSVGGTIVFDDEAESLVDYLADSILAAERAAREELREQAAQVAEHHAAIHEQNYRDGITVCNYAFTTREVARYIRRLPIAEAQ